MTVMYRDCDEFTTTTEEDGGIPPLQNECPSYGDVEFKHNGCVESL